MGFRCEVPLQMKVCTKTTSLNSFWAIRLETTSTSQLYEKASREATETTHHAESTADQLEVHLRPIEIVQVQSNLGPDCERSRHESRRAEVLRQVDGSVGVVLRRFGSSSSRVQRRKAKDGAREVL